MTVGGSTHFRACSQSSKRLGTRTEVHVPVSALLHPLPDLRLAQGRRDAALQWKQLVKSLGEPCPGDEGLFTPPDPDRLARTAPWSLRALGIDERRATTLIAAARVARRLHGLADAPLADAQRILQTIPGVGPWTVSCLSAFTWGDPDTVITGDSGIPSLIASTLTGARRADDAAMLKLLEPYRPHRYRVLRLALAARTRPASQRAGILM